MKPRKLITEPIELAILDRLQAGETIAKIARDLNVWRMQVWRIKQRGEPRWRHRANGELHPSPAVIIWCRNKIKANWTAEEEFRNRVQKSMEYEVLRASMSDLELSEGELEWNPDGEVL